MVTQAPSKESLSVEQIKKFISESIAYNKKWKHIRILGGEPTLHKDIFEIIDILIDYKKSYSRFTKLQLVTNGNGNAVKAILEKIPDEVEIENSIKTSNIQPQFSAVNNAPIDNNINSDFSKGCWIPSVCGMALDMHGYYPCTVAAAIDRVFGFDIGQKSLEKCDEQLTEALSKLCKNCGHFEHEINYYADRDIISDNEVVRFEEIHKCHFDKINSEKNNGEIVSVTWQKKLDAYKSRRPKLTSY